MGKIIYTNENDCQDCYKCVRRCPVKAIKMINNHASIEEERCIMCGACIAVCPAGAQKYRNDEDCVKELLQTKERVIMAVAPAFASELDFSVNELILTAKKLGFYGVSETALGAQIVTWFQRELLSDSDRPLLSTACPTFVHLVMKYFPQWKDNLSPLLSPLLSQCVMLRKIYGDDIGIVFVGPCLAKKSEADIHPELLDIAITFDEFQHLVLDSDIDLNSIKVESKKESESFIPTHSNGGAIYPLDGGMVETITNLNPASVVDSALFHYAGTKTIQEILQSENFKLSNNIFCEFLACEGGCINGSGIFNDNAILSKRNKIAEYFKQLDSYPEEEFIDQYAPESVSADYAFCEPVKIKEFSNEEKQKIWKKLGKYEEKDFIDCGACGYNTCDNFAVACLEQRAELEMCATCMKKQAQNKVRAFMKETPLALCVLDKYQKILECNYKFIEMSMEVEIDITDEVLEHAKGTHVDRFFPVSEVAVSSIKSESKVSRIISHEKRIFDVMAFPFEKHDLSGVIIQDITKPAIKRDVVISKAQGVIKNNLMTVQKIAFLLGETAAETEITLNEIISAYKTNEEK